jgi:hypothetical protein
LFKDGLVTQGRFLVKMITLILSELNNDQKFNDVLYKLVVVHNSKGVKASEYGLVGEVLFYALRKCIGEAYTVQLSRIWIKIFSRMLRVIVPKAIALELASAGDNQDRRQSDYEADEKKIEYLQTERRKQLVELSKEGACPFSHEADQEAKSMKAELKVIADGKKEYLENIRRKSSMVQQGDGF